MRVIPSSTNESLCVGDQVRITVLRISGNRVRLGIETPAEVPIVRQRMVCEEVVKSNQEGNARGCEVLLSGPAKG